MNSRPLQALNTTVGALLVLGCVIAINLLARPLRGLRVDLTEDHVYTLSDGTRRLLRNLDRPLEIKFFYSNRSEEMPRMLKNYAARVEDLLHEYQRIAGANLKLSIIHPQPLSDEEEWARKYGLQAAGSGAFGTDGFFLGVVAISGARESAIPFLNPNDEARLEYNLSRMIHEVTRAKPPRIGVYSSLPVFGTPRMPMMMMGQPPPQPAWISISQLRQTAEVVRVESLAENLPSDLDALLVIHPKDLDAAAQYRIDQYVVNGGRLIALVDPVSLVERSRQGQNPMMMMGASFSSDLPLLLPRWGIRYDASKVLADRGLAAEHTARETGVAHPLWLLARTPNLNPEEIPTRGLDLVQFAFAGGLEATPPQGVHLFPLVSASSENDLIDAMMATMSDPASLVKQMNPGDTRRQIALRLIGTFPSAFDSAPEGFDPAAHRARGEKPGQVIVVADADWIFDQMLAQQYTFMGRTVIEPLGDNLAFFLNLAEQSIGADELIALRSRGTFDRPFHVVNDLLRKAESAGRAEIEALQREISEAQERVREIARSGDPEKRIGLDKALREEQAALEDKIFQASRRLRDIERERRRDVDALKFRLQAANIVLVPALVGVFGLVRGLLRKRRSNQNA